MHGSAFLGIDVGSAGVRAGIYDQAGTRLGFAERVIQQFWPGPDMVEQSSADIWAQLCAAVREACAGSPLPVCGIGVDATCSLVAVDAAGGPVSVAADGDSARDIIMWMDHRALAEAAALNATGDACLAYVGGEVGLEMELPKILWLRRHLPRQARRVAQFFDLADYLVWRMTGADAASTCTLACKWNYLAHEERFSQPMLDAVGLGDLPGLIPRTVLPLGASAGGLSDQAAHALGLPRGIPVGAGIIDARAGGLALAGSQPAGTLALIAGTSNCHMIASQGPVMVPGVWGPYWGAMLPGLWLNEGGQSAAGALLDWTMQQSDAWPALQADAREQGHTPHALLNERVAALEAREPSPALHLHVLPDHHGNRSPRADARARGMMVGLSLEAGLDGLARHYLATVQALAYGTREIIDAMRAAGHRIDRIVACGGSTKNPLWLREHADATGGEVHQAEDEDAVTLGAALLDATAAGAFPGLTAAATAMVRPGATTQPRPGTRAVHDAKYAVYTMMHADAGRYRAAMELVQPC